MPQSNCPECNGLMVSATDSGHYVCSACRAADRAEQDAVLLRMAAALPPATTVLTIAEPPYPETLAVLHEKYGPGVVVWQAPWREDERVTA